VGTLVACMANNLGGLRDRGDSQKSCVKRWAKGMWCWGRINLRVAELVMTGDQKRGRIGAYLARKSLLNITAAGTPLSEEHNGGPAVDPNRTRKQERKGLCDRRRMTCLTRQEYSFRKNLV